MVQNLYFEVVERKTKIQDRKNSFIERNDAPSILSVNTFIFLRGHDTPI